MPQEPSRLQTSPHRFYARARFTIQILHRNIDICINMRYQFLSCKKRSIQHRGPQRPHHKRHNDVVAAVLQAGANQKRGDSHLRPSIARPQVLSMGAAGHYDPFTTLCIFQSLLNTPKNARWEVHHLSAAGSMPWFCPYRGIGAAQKAPAARKCAAGASDMSEDDCGANGQGPAEPS